jgi:hypothetical protein
MLSVLLWLWVLTVDILVKQDTAADEYQRSSCAGKAAIKE